MARVLVIEDEARVRDLLREILEDAGHQVVLAADGREGLRQCRAGPVDLVITDLIMPEQEGLETIRALRRERAGLPVIAVSGGGLGRTGDFLATARALGAVRAVAKPFGVQEILAAVEAALAWTPPSSSPP